VGTDVGKGFGAEVGLALLFKFGIGILLGMLGLCIICVRAGNCGFMFGGGMGAGKGWTLGAIIRG